jgi:glycerate kinase
MADGWRSAAPRDELDLAPLSDGGPGLVDVLAAALPQAVRLSVEVEDPLGRPVEAAVLLDGTTAYVEAAQACGLHLLADTERDPKRTSSAGVGQLVRAARDAGARRVVVGLGGTATNDGGAGMLWALGVRPVGARPARGGAALRALSGLDGWPDLDGVELVVATDVDSPLLGLYGASAAFGPQKGATREDVALLDAALAQWADVLEAHARRRVRDVPGAGAGGGLGAPCWRSVRSRARHRARAAARRARRPRRTGRPGAHRRGHLRLLLAEREGRLGVAALAAEQAVPCLVLAGAVRVGRREAGAAGIEATYSLVEAVGVEAALTRPAQELAAWQPGRAAVVAPAACHHGRVLSPHALLRRNTPDSHGGPS